jgi:hypothetical protein
MKPLRQSEWTCRVPPVEQAVNCSPQAKHGPNDDVTFAKITESNLRQQLTLVKSLW